jgi:hypothetical protein
MSENQSITSIYNNNPPQGLRSEIADLAAAYPGTVRLGRFPPLVDLGAPSTFPTLDPSLIDLFKQVTVIITTASASLDFYRKLREIISKSPGKSLLRMTSRKSRSSSERCTKCSFLAVPEEHGLMFL